MLVIFGAIYVGTRLSIVISILALTAAGIPVKVESYNGSHSNQLAVRIREHMLPFFSNLLQFE